MADDFINYSYVIKPYIKTLNNGVQELPVCWTYPHAGNTVNLDPTGPETLALENFLGLTLHTSSSGSSFMLFIITCDHKYKFLSSVNYQICEGIVGGPNFVVSQAEVWDLICGWHLKCDSFVEPIP